MAIDVSDHSSNKNEQIVHAAEEIGRSRHKSAVFKGVYRGKQSVKSVVELEKATGLSKKRVLDAGKQLASQNIVEQVKENGATAYRKIAFFQSHRDRILRLAADPRQRDQIPTKRQALVPRTGTVKIRCDLTVPAKRVRAKHITVDEIDSFAGVRIVETNGYERIPETTFKNGVAAILGESASFKDWGGENRDIFTTRLKMGGKRYRTAIAFKGPGKTGKLTPGKMGKNGDQIQRLMRCPADVFLVQYWAEIDDSVIEQLSSLAQAKSYLEDRDIWYGIIDGADSKRIIKAYPDKFGRSRHSD